MLVVYQQVAHRAARSFIGNMGIQIDMNRIFFIESTNNPKAWNKKSNARGLGQITPDALTDWNTYNPMQKYNLENLFDADINSKVSDWYYNNRIPTMLNAYKISDTVENRLIAYNAGIGRLKNHIGNGVPLKQETEDYIIKYHMGGDVRVGQQKLKELGFDPGPIDGIIGKRTRAAWKTFQESTVNAPVIERKHGIQRLKQ